MGALVGVAQCGWGEVGPLVGVAQCGWGEVGALVGVAQCEVGGLVGGVSSRWEHWWVWRNVDGVR